jgi:hypothetical protein
MEINFNNSANKAVGVRLETLDASQVSRLAHETAEGSQSSATGLTQFLTITESTASPEDIAAAEIPDAALSRDDALGRLVGEAFNLPPPPMPAFDANHPTT